MQATLDEGRKLGLFEEMLEDEGDDKVALASATPSSFDPSNRMSRQRSTNRR